MFPGGGPGIALLLIRVGVGASLLLENGSHPIGVLSRCDVPFRIAIAAMLLAGVLTPVIALLAVALAAADLIVVGFGNAPIASLVALDAIALGLLGPGAYSFDARRFGRRVLVTSADEAKSDRSPRTR
jgi:hypothetical protein